MHTPAAIRTKMERTLCTALAAIGIAALAEPALSTPMYEVGVATQYSVAAGSTFRIQGYFKNTGDEDFRFSSAPGDWKFSNAALQYAQPHLFFQSGHPFADNIVGSPTQFEGNTIAPGQTFTYDLAQFKVLDAPQISEIQIRFHSVFTKAFDSFGPPEFYASTYGPTLPELFLGPIITITISDADIGPDVVFVQGCVFQGYPYELVSGPAACDPTSIIEPSSLAVLLSGLTFGTLALACTGRRQRGVGADSRFLWF